MITYYMLSTIPGSQWGDNYGRDGRPALELTVLLGTQIS